MWFGIISLFPEMFAALNAGIIGKAIDQKRIALEFFNPRDFSHNKHSSVDDKPYGGGSGMVMMPGPIDEAIIAAKKKSPSQSKVVYLSPQGQLFNQGVAEKLAQLKAIIFLAGRYEGIDERVIALHIDEEWSIGDYIVTGGEIPVMVVIDAIARLLPGVVGDENSIMQDSITSGLLKYAQFTRPEDYQGYKVPPVLLSGNHEAIRQWRLKDSLRRTWLRRPKLLKNKLLSAEEENLLAVIKAEMSSKKEK